MSTTDTSTTYTAEDWEGAEGAEGAEESSQGGGGLWRRPGYFKLADKETELVRFLTDRQRSEGAANQQVWVTVNVHSRVPTGRKPEGYEGNWPPNMSATCRKSKPPIFKRLFDDKCPLCDTGHKPKARTYALVVMREEVLEGGRKVGVVDRTRQVQKLDEAGEPVEGEVEVVPDIRLVEQSWFGFFDKLAGMSSRRGTLADRDVAIGRKGAGKTDTEYTPSDDDPFPVPDPANPGQTVVYDLRLPQFWARYAALGSDLLPDLRQYVLDRCSVEYLDRFFFGKGKGSTSKHDAAEAGGSGGGQPSAPGTEMSAEEAAAAKADIMSRLKGRAPDGGEGGAAASSDQVMAHY